MSTRIVPKTILNVQQECTLSLYMPATMESFAEALRRKMLERDNISASELSRQSGVSKQNISRIINNIPHSQTNAKPKVTEVTVRKLARVLRWNINEALKLAGYATPETKPAQTLKDYITQRYNAGEDLPPYLWTIIEQGLLAQIKAASSLTTIECKVINQPLHEEDFIPIPIVEIIQT